MGSSGSSPSSRPSASALETWATKHSDAPTAPVREQLAALVEDRDLQGSAFGRARSALIDEWLASLVPEHNGAIALLAVGGYGRRALAPESDLDLLLVHDGVKGVGAIADAIWYPIWDAGLALDHSVRTPAEATNLARTDVKVALGLLDARVVAGDVALGEKLIDDAREQWHGSGKRLLADLEAIAAERHERAGPVAFLLEPDLKDGAGGLRDATVLRALASAFPVEPSAEVDEAVEELFAARVELQRLARRREERLLLELQDDVAASLGDADADRLMHRIATCGRRLSWHLDDGWRTARAVAAGPRRRSDAGRDHRVGPGIVERDGEISLSAAAGPVDGALALQVAAAAATRDRPIARTALRILDAGMMPGFEVWSPAARGALVELLGAGAATVSVFESLDQYDLVSRILPEWAAVRSRPQRNAFHRFTVDRHLVEAAVQASRFTSRVARSDLLLIGAWLHDLGKGYPGDHTDVGIGLMRVIGTRMGYDPDDVETLVAMVRYHLLLPSVATSRDLDDPETIAGVATTIASVELLELLHSLTEADSLATGPSAWNPWKERLVDTLLERVRAKLNGVAHVHGTSVPEADAAVVARAEGGVLVEGAETHLVVVAPDEPGVFSRVVGLLALDGHDVRAARARSTNGVAISEYDLEPRRGETPDWAAFETRLRDTLAGSLELGDALSERAESHARLRRPRAAKLDPPRLTVDNDASVHATVLEVHAPDEVGVLHRIARVLADEGLDIRHAKVSTLGPEVIDTFYVVTGQGQKVMDAERLAELEASILGGIVPRASETAG